MKQRRARSLTLLTLLVLTATPALAQYDGLYPVFELTDADLDAIDLHDNSAQDWIRIVGEPSFTHEEFSDLAGASLADGLAFRVWLAWHDATERIYLGMERKCQPYGLHADVRW